MNNIKELINLEKLNYNIKQLNEETKKLNQELNSNSKCIYNTKYELLKNDNILRPQHYVNIYDSNFGGLIGTTLGKK